MVEVPNRELVKRWPFSKLRQRWLELEASVARAGWREWDELPPLYREVAEVLGEELHRRGDTPPLF